jgi:hypothetical protein
MSATHEDILLAVTRVEVAVHEHAKRIADHESRMRELEMFKAKLIGWAAAASMAGSIVAQVLMGMLK